MNHVTNFFKSLHDFIERYDLCFYEFIGNIINITFSTTENELYDIQVSYDLESEYLITTLIGENKKVHSYQKVPITEITEMLDNYKFEDFIYNDDFINDYVTKGDEEDE